MELDLKGKRALVTGASSGIGESTAKMLAGEGAIVGVHGRNLERIDKVVTQIRQAGGEAFPLAAELGNDAQVEALAQDAQAKLGGVDILICNAGGRAELAPLGWQESTLENYRSTFQMNVGYSVRLIQLLAPAMRERGFGRIVLISSAAGLQPMGNQPDYGAAKAAMISLVVSTSKWLRSSGVTINAISPGAVLTPQLQDYLTGVGVKKGWPDEWETIERNAASQLMKIPVGRVGRPAEIAGMVSYLCSPLAGFVHGTDIHIDGGVIGTFT